MDRVGIALSVDSSPLTLEQKLDAIDRVISYDDNTFAKNEVAEIKEAEDQLKTRIIFAREDLKDTKLTKSQITYLCEEATRAGCQGHRAEIFAAEVARASAALNDRKPNADDLKAAVRLAILPRGTYVNNPEMMESPPPPPPPPPPPQPSPTEEQEQQADDQQDQENEDQDQDDDEKEQEEDDEEIEEAPDSVPTEFMFDAVGTPMDSELLNFATRQKQVSLHLLVLG